MAVRTQHPRQVESIEAGQVQVEQRKIVRRCLQCRQRRQSVWRMHHHVALRLQQRADHLGHEGIVLDQQDAP